MSRPFYETSAHLKAEQEVANFFSERWKCEMQKLPRGWPLDYCGKRNEKVLSFIEIKCRDEYSYRKLDELGGLMIDLRKLVALRHFCTESLLPGLICIRTSSGHFFHKDDGLRGYEMVWGGRSDRGDPADKEPCVLIPMSRFEPA